jgi:BirA family transcriptional regulator, biotin operon repressor / biotin---[acetyl-CoA-carboxylase] ligase
MKKEDIIHKLRTKKFGQNLFYRESLDSTNTFAKTLPFEDSPEGTVILAEFQTGGRGRQGRQWYSRPGKNLTFSLILRPRFSLEVGGLLSLYASLAVASALGNYPGVHAQCKWPNDVLVNEHKISGILSEAVVAQNGALTVIIGIGINVNETNFPPGLLKPATSLALACGKELDRAEVFCGVLEELERTYPLLDEGGRATLVARWSARSSMLGKEVLIDQNGTTVRGIARQIAGDGHLVVETTTGSVSILSGDVTNA